MGLPASAVDAYLQSEAREEAIEVLECNWQCYQVFTRCDPTLHIGMAGAVYTGVPSAEVEAAMRVSRIPLEDQPAVFDGVKHMMSVWCKTRNAVMATR